MTHEQRAKPMFKHLATGLSRDTQQNKDFVGCPIFIGLRAGRPGSTGSNCPPYVGSQTFKFYSFYYYNIEH